MSLLTWGIVQLNRAQSFQDSARRKTELEAAEKTFLAIRGLAGETDEYRLFLGQVYYWLGRAPEGKELFDQLLVSRKRGYGILMSLARPLREVGEEKQARDLLEEAHRIGQAGRERFQAAASRAVLARDVADRSPGWRKADPNEPATPKVALNGARGEQALEQGRKEPRLGSCARPSPVMTRCRAAPVCSTTRAWLISPSLRSPVMRPTSIAA